MSNRSIYPIDRSLSGATISGQGGYKNNSNKEAFPITGATPSDCLMSYLGHSWGVLLTTEMQLV